ncbi:MAG: hypothetical protein ACFHWX_09340 [Bacteroidota bacterium]
MKNLKKYFGAAPLLIALFCFAFTSVNAQLKTPSSVGKFEKGTITTKKGKEIEGYIYIDMMNPQEFQKRVNLIDEKTYQAWLKGKKINKDIEVYDAKDLESFTLDNSKKFKKARYVNIFATRKQDMLPKNLMLEVAAEGKITVFKKYHHTQGFVSSYLPDRSKVSDAEYAEWQENNFEILYQKEGEGSKNMSVINIKALVGDNETVLTNYQNDFYGFQTLFTKGPVFESSFQTDALEAFARMVDDYNKS